MSVRWSGLAVEVLVLSRKGSAGPEGCEREFGGVENWVKGALAASVLRTTDRTQTGRLGWRMLTGFWAAGETMS